MPANTQPRVRVLTRFPVERLDRVRARVPEAELIAIPGEGDLPQQARGEIVLTLPWGTANLPVVIQRGVRWIHAVGTGVDGFPLATVGDRLLTCLRGASVVPIASPDIPDRVVLVAIHAGPKAMPAYERAFERASYERTFEEGVFHQGTKTSAAQVWTRRPSSNSERGAGKT